MKLNTMACIVMASAMLLSCGDKKETEKEKKE